LSLGRRSTGTVRPPSEAIDCTRFLSDELTRWILAKGFEGWLNVA
jgi:hypothetical protein